MFNKPAFSAKQTLTFILLLLVLSFCDDGEPSVGKGKALFTVAGMIDSRPGGRIEKVSIPAFVLIGIEDVYGKPIETKKMALYDFGAHFITDELELATGDYRLTQFAVLDSSNRVIYAAPVKGADMAPFVSSPLPVDFSISENTSIDVVSEVLAVKANDSPEHFGYASFDFEVAEIPPTPPLIDLPVKLLQGQSQPSTFDSVYIRLFNPNMVMLKQQRLIVDSVTQSASGMIKGLSPGDWKLSVLYFKNIAHQKQSELHSASAAVTIQPSTTGLLSNGQTVWVNEQNGSSSERIMTQEKYFAFYFFDNQMLTSVITLPVDPLNPFFEIYFLHSDWQYFYADRSFYDEHPGEPGSRYHQGSAAFEKYNDAHQPLDYIDSTSFKPLTSIMSNKSWHFADCLVIGYIDGVEQPLFYYQWNTGNSNGGRLGFENLTEQGINLRRKSNLKHLN